MADLDNFKPLTDANSAVTLGDFEISNDDNAINIGGSLRLEPNNADIENAIRLANLFDRIAKALKRAKDEGKRATKIKPTKVGKDEFGLPS